MWDILNVFGSFFGLLDGCLEVRDAERSRKERQHHSVAPSKIPLCIGLMLIAAAVVIALVRVAHTHQIPGMQDLVIPFLLSLVGFFFVMVYAGNARYRRR